MDTRKTAKKILDITREKFSIKHTYSTTNPKNFPHLDHRFYQQTSEKFSKLGFSYLADLEDLTLKAQKPDPRTFIKVYFSPEKTVLAAKGG